MKLRNHNQPSDPDNYCRQYYTGCGIEAVNEAGEKFVGVVTLVEPDRLEAIMFSEPELHSEDEVRVPPPYFHCTTEYFLRSDHRRVSKKEYLLYKLKGWNLP